jgi:hypothetical protein
MRKSLPYEIAAAVTALVGAGILVGVYFPLLNPRQYRVETGRLEEPLAYFLFLTPIPIVILVVSWRLNRKAQALKQEEKNAKSSA